MYQSACSSVSSFAETIDKKSLLLDFQAALPYIDLLKKKKAGIAFGPVSPFLSSFLSIAFDKLTFVANLQCIITGDFCLSNERLIDISFRLCYQQGRGRCICYYK